MVSVIDLLFRFLLLVTEIWFCFFEKDVLWLSKNGLGCSFRFSIWKNRRLLASISFHF